MFTKPETEYLLSLVGVDDDGFSDWTPQADIRTEVLRKLEAHRAELEKASARITQP